MSAIMSKNTKKKKTDRREKKPSGTPAPAAYQSIVENPLFQAVFIALAAVIVYANILSAPFYFDDTYHILDNQAIRKIGNVYDIWRYSPARFLSIFSLAVNYAVNAYNVTGYHVMNIVIHVFSCVFIFLFAGKLCGALRLSEKNRVYLPFLSALLFAVSPINTQAVTYIVQRMTSMAAMFFFGAMFYYLSARLLGKGRKAACYYGLFALFTAAAFLSKQNAYVLPLAVFLLEWLVLKTKGKRLLSGLAASFAALFCMWVVVALFYGFNPFSIKQILAVTRESRDITRLDYFMTQTRVLWIYIKLFFWPVGLRVDYDLALSRQFFTAPVLGAITGHILMLAAAFLSRKRFPVVSFSIFFYYTAHLIESSFLPITDLVNEHRAYMPNMGLSILTAYGIIRAHEMLAGKIARKPLIAATGAFVILILASLASATVMRNAMWNHPTAFWIDNAKKAPESYRANNEAGKYLNTEGKYEQAMPYLWRAMVLSSPDKDEKNLRPEMPALLNYMISLIELGRYDMAEKMAQDALTWRLPKYFRAKVFDRLGDIRSRQNRDNEAEDYFKKSIKLFPGNIPTWAYLGISLEKQAKRKEAKKIFNKVLEMDPENPFAKQFFINYRNYNKKNKAAD